MVMRSLPNVSYSRPQLAAQLEPCGSRGAMSRIRTTRVSPGSAPATEMGPVMMWTPGFRVSSGMPSQMARMPSSMSRSGASPAWWVTASMSTMSPEAISSTAGCSRSKYPQKQVSGVAVSRCFVVSSAAATAAAACGESSGLTIGPTYGSSVSAMFPARDRTVTPPGHAGLRVPAAPRPAGRSQPGDSRLPTVSVASERVSVRGPSNLPSRWSPARTGSYFGGLSGRDTSAGTR